MKSLRSLIALALLGTLVSFSQVGCVGGSYAYVPVPVRPVPVTVYRPPVRYGYYGGGYYRGGYNRGYQRSYYGRSGSYNGYRGGSASWGGGSGSWSGPRGGSGNWHR